MTDTSKTGQVVESHEEKIKRLSENGKNEVKELTLSLGDKEYKAIIVVNFDLFKKAYSILLDAKYEQTKKGASPEVSVEMDMLGAGDKLLFFGWHEGNEEIKEKFKLRTKAAQALGVWFTGLVGDEDEETEKKS
jgi:hypothetical protein